MHLLYSLLYPFQVIGGFFHYLVNPRKLLDISLAASVAFFVALFLALCVVGVSTVLLFHGGGALISPYALGVLILLTLVIPCVVYYFIVELTRPPVTEFPEIDAAWQAGLDALQAQGIAMRRVPLFVITGLADAAEMDALMEASGLPFAIKGIPSGSPPLRWYAGDYFDQKLDQRVPYVFVACLGIGSLGRMTLLAKDRQEGSTQSGGADRLDFPEEISVRRTLTAGGGDESEYAPRGGPAPAPVFNARQTLVVGEDTGTDPGEMPRSSGSGMQAYREREMRKMAHLGRLMLRSRQPVCSLNGVLNLLPVDLLKQWPDDIPIALQDDIGQLQATTKVFAPVTLLVTRMEKQWGFIELVRRIGMSRAKVSRFGKGGSVRMIPTDENLEAVSAHACGIFEDFAYDLFGRAGDFQRPGNSKLYTLLCHIRQTIQRPLRSALMHGYGSPPGTLRLDLPKMFGGCYFAASGSSDEQQAFLRGVFSRVLELHEELEWLPEAIERDRRSRWLATCVMYLVAVEGLLLVALVVFNFL